MKRRNVKIIDKDSDGNIYGYCVICNKVIHKRGRVTCCDECAKKLEIQTKLDKYGCMFKDSKLTKEKRKQTCLQKYGVDNYTKTQEYKDKSKATNLIKYGCESHNQSEMVKNKKRETCLKRYGVDNHTKTKEYRDKMKSLCISKYGKEYFSQINIQHYENYNREFIIENFVDNDLFDITACADYFNMSWFGVKQAKERLNLTMYKNKLFKGTSKAESDIKEFCNQFTDIKEKDRTILCGKEIDIVLVDELLCIEYNGIYWHGEHILNERGENGVNYHLDKTEKCENKGYALFHIFDTDDIDIWKSMISNKLGKSNIVYARKCEIREVSNEESRVFLNNNHLQGNCISSIKYGLYYNNELVELITFGKSRFNKNYDYELLRLCTKKYTTVVGGASKLFKHFLKQVGKCKIISYANRRFSKGSIYKTLGFKWLRNTKPNYFYFKRDVVLTRNDCQKHKLKDLLGDNFDSNLTEVENMYNNGFDRIFDSGNMVFEYINE